MTQAAGLPTREPVCDIPREAALPCPEPQPETLPDKARFLSGAISFSIIPRLRVKEPRRRLMALETAVTRCAKHAVKPLAPPPCTVWSTLLSGASCCTIWLVGACTALGSWLPAFAEAASRRRPSWTWPTGRETSVPVALSATAPTTPTWSASTTWPPGVWAVSSIVAQAQAAIEPSPFAEIESAISFPKVHALPNDGRQRAGLNLGKPVFPESGFWIPIHWARPYRRQMPRAQDVSRALGCAGCADLSGFGMAPPNPTGHYTSPSNTIPLRASIELTPCNTPVLGPHLALTTANAKS